MGADRVDAGRRGATGPVKQPSNRGPAPRGTTKKSSRRNDGNGRKLGLLLGVIALLGAAALGYAWYTGRTQVTTVDPSLPPLAAEGHVEGSPTAPLEVLEFGDYECPQCGNFATITGPDVRKRLIETGQIRLRYFDFPLPMHPNSWTASHAGMCAEEQGKFWPMHDRIYGGLLEWYTAATRNPTEVFTRYATELGLDAGKFETCVKEERYKRKIEANLAEGSRRGINSTPTFVIGSKVIPGNIPYDRFKAYVDSAIARGETTPPAPAAPAAAVPPAAAGPGAR